MCIRDRSSSAAQNPTAAAALKQLSHLSLIHIYETVYKKLFAILEKLNIVYFFDIGGNDSMDTIGKLAEYGNRIQSDIRFMGVPKTIANDLMVTDHTPGYEMCIRDSR